jgi:tetratricopeptide (TPR) repeat protein
MMKAILTAALIFCVSVGFSQYNLYKSGVDAYNEGKYHDAISNLSEYLRKNARDKKLDVEAYYARGMAHYKNSAYTPAIDDFRQTIALGRKNKGNLYWLIGKCLSSKGDYYQAIESFTEAAPYISDNLKQSQLLFDRAFAYRKIQQKDLAEATLKRCLMLNPDHYMAQDALAEIVSSQDQTMAKKSPDASTAKRIALIIGNANYNEPVGHLKNPVNDAFAIAEELKKLNFTTVVKVNQTSAEIKKAIRAFHAQLKESNPSNTVGLFYYAGHGLQVDGTNYIIPIDAAIKLPKDVERTCIPVDAALDAMQYADVKMSVMILDACRNNPFHGTEQSIAKGLAPPNPAVGAFIAYATAPGSVASDGAASHGLYTQEIIKALRVPGLSIEQVFKKVRENVLQLSDGHQHTWDTSNLVSDFYFNK